MSQAQIGMHKTEIDTPALLIDLDLVDENISVMAGYFRGVDSGLRPHVKTHKTPILAHKQLEAGAIGITCAKLGEAEVMRAGGIEDILIANQIVGPLKTEKLANLAKHAHITVAVDNLDNIKMLSDAASHKGIKLGALIEIDIGMGRCGVEPGQEALELARNIVQSPGLHFHGLMGYEGHIIFEAHLDKKEKEARSAIGLLLDTKQLLESDGIEVSTISCGGTGTYDIVSSIPGVTEVQAGSYITMDGKYHETRHEFKCALTLLTTVISIHEGGRVIVDCGRKSLSQDFGMSKIVDFEGVGLQSLSEEHGILELGRSDAQFKIGQKIEVLPNHGCTTINLHDNFIGIRNAKVEVVWPIAARGTFW